MRQTRATHVQPNAAKAHRDRMREVRGREVVPVCEVCGYSDTIDMHHDENRKLHALCPNHHALVTRKGKTLVELCNPDKLSVQPKLRVAGLKMEGNTIVGVDKAAQNQPEGLPLYNPAIHKPGDRVMVRSPYGKKLVETVIPELDADGNPIPRF